MRSKDSVFAFGVFIDGFIYFNRMILQDFSGYANILFSNAAINALVRLLITQLEIDIWR